MLATRHAAALATDSSVPLAADHSVHLAADRTSRLGANFATNFTANRAIEHVTDGAADLATAFATAFVTALATALVTAFAAPVAGRALFDVAAAMRLQDGGSALPFLGMAHGDDEAEHAAPRRLALHGTRFVAHRVEFHRVRGKTLLQQGAARLLRSGEMVEDADQHKGQGRWWRRMAAGGTHGRAFGRYRLNLTGEP